MKKTFRWIVPLTAAILLAVPQTALAAQTISSVSLTIDSNISVGDDDSDVDVTTSASKYEVEDVEVTNEPVEWEEDDKPKLRITLTANDDFELDVYDLEWDETYGYGSWDGAEDAKKYEVRLYRGNSAVTSILTTSSEQFNFAPYFTTSGYYAFRVRGVYSTSHKGDWEESDSWYLTDAQALLLSASSAAVDTAAASTAASSGSSGPAGSSSGGSWLKDSVGWWYYCGSDGAMLANTTTPDGYYVGSDGAWIQ